MPGRAVRPSGGIPTWGGYPLTKEKEGSFSLVRRAAFPDETKCRKGIGNTGNLLRRTTPNSIEIAGLVMPNCYAIFLSPPVYEGNGRGGIRTHGGFPHARFRVECLKPDSATLPIARYCPCYFRRRNCRPLSVQRQSMARGFGDAMDITLTDGGIETDHL